MMIVTRRPPVWRTPRPPLLQRLCGRLTRHRWTRPTGVWVDGHALGSLPARERTEECRVCGFGLVCWRLK